MASNAAHKSSGWAAGVIAAAVVAHSGIAGPYHIWSALAFLFGYSGGGAPDWLELKWWRWKRGRGRHTWIAHRTWTHWGLAWIGLLVGSFYALPYWSWAALPFGFAAGGVMHLCADAPNPMGVPWFWGSWRLSLNLWKSGKCDWLIVGVAWIGAWWYADRAWFDGDGAVYAAKVLHKSLFSFWPT